MKLQFVRAIATGMVAVASVCITQAASIPTLINFDPPGTTFGPSIYVAVPAQQTIVTNPATFTGGVVLGLATFFPAIAFATSPNVYGTANFGNGLATSLTMTIDPAYLATEVSFALFNGETFNQDYQVDAYNGVNIIATQTFAAIPPNFNSGFALVDLNAAAGITSVVIAPTRPTSIWDFLIDTVAFNQNITAVVVQPPDPCCRQLRYFPQIR